MKDWTPEERAALAYLDARVVVEEHGVRRLMLKAEVPADWVEIEQGVYSPKCGTIAKKTPK